MADMIDRIVEQTIANSLTILTTSQQPWSVARAGIEKIHHNLALRSPRPSRAEAAGGVHRRTGPSLPRAVTRRRRGERVAGGIMGCHLAS